MTYTITTAHKPSISSLIFSNSLLRPLPVRSSHFRTESHSGITSQDIEMFPLIDAAARATQDRRKTRDTDTPRLPERSYFSSLQENTQHLKTGRRAEQHLTEVTPDNTWTEIEISTPNNPAHDSITAQGNISNMHTPSIYGSISSASSSRQSHSTDTSRASSIIEIATKSKAPIRLFAENNTVSTICFYLSLPFGLAMLAQPIIQKIHPPAQTDSPLKAWLFTAIPAISLLILAGLYEEKPKKNPPQNANECV